MSSATPARGTSTTKMTSASKPACRCAPKISSPSTTSSDTTSTSAPTRTSPRSFEQGANDGFHEAIGDTIALSITPAYLKQVGLINEIPQQDDVALLLHQALDKVAFLPFGLLIDQWRWKVFSGEIKPADYNKAWWQLREHYQGVFPPVERTEADFDPGAKYHVPANVPYTRYFLARILQFQFYRAMCREAGHTGPLYTCSFYDNKQAGAKLAAMLEMGTRQALAG